MFPNPGRISLGGLRVDGVRSRRRGRGCDRGAARRVHRATTPRRAPPPAPPTAPGHRLARPARPRPGRPRRPRGRRRRGPTPTTSGSATAMAAVRHLAGRIGPRPGTSPAYFRAARLGRVPARPQLGWTVERQRFRTPAGCLVGRPGRRRGRRSTWSPPAATCGPASRGSLVGAHLDTVPQAPGAEDNASGIGVLLATAEALAGHRTRLPVVLVAFGSEEPRGPTDDDHHYGSTAYVAVAHRRRAPDPARHGLAGPGRRRRRGAGRQSPHEPMPCTGRAARRGPHGPAVADRRSRPVRRSSDHWSFVAGGAARRPARQHAVRRLPLGRRRARRSSTRPSCERTAPAACVAWLRDR